MFGYLTTSDGTIYRVNSNMLVYLNHNNDVVRVNPYGPTYQVGTETDGNDRHIKWTSFDNLEAAKAFIDSRVAA